MNIKSITKWIFKFLFQFEGYSDDEILIQRAQYLSVFLTGTIFFLFILTVIYLVKLFNSPSNEPFLLYIFVNTIDVGIILGLRYANKKGHVKWVAYVFLFLVIGSITLGLFVSGLESIYVLYFLPVIAASFVLVPISSIFLAGVSIASFSMVQFLSPIDHSFNPIFFVTILAAAVITF